ncbi:MAG: hypothetical protein ACK5L0_04940 [Candidatus Fimivivens sp.]
MNFENTSVILMVLGVLIAVTNVFTQVTKQFTFDKVPTNIIAALWGIALTVLAFFMYAAYCGLTIVWYMVAAAVVLGVLVAYAAMFGFDKLKEIFTKNGVTVTGVGDKDA